ncbi:5184_t:CDS:2 [Scutellospora calospora]|uniref:5184_t:CDS:1 n=1 Tax=Scutellospora calospora TaxID=85575 RepID=A0ACA9KW12_9GLOM|nr:5184_t:CDS:2 [Scutellospora calospora]
MSTQNYKRQLLAPGIVVQKLHYRPFAVNWWVFPKAKTVQNKKDSEAIIYSTSSVAINMTYNKFFKAKTHFFSPGVLDIYHRENKIQTYTRKSPDDVWTKLDILKNYNGKNLFRLCDQLVIQAIQTYITALYCKAYWYQFFIRWRQQSTTIIEFSSHLASIYPADFKFINTILGLEFWTCAEDPSSDHTSIFYLYTKNLLNSVPYNLLETELSIIKQDLQNKVNQFWSCFDTSIKMNKCGVNRKQRILLIIANNFKQYEIQEKLKITHAIKRYIRIEYNLDEGEKIQATISDLKRTSVANIEPSQFSPFEISKLTMISINKPTPNITAHSIPKNPWSFPLS